MKSTVAAVVLSSLLLASLVLAGAATQPARGPLFNVPPPYASTQPSTADIEAENKILLDENAKRTTLMLDEISKLRDENARLKSRIKFLEMNLRSLRAQRPN